MHYSLSTILQFKQISYFCTTYGCNNVSNFITFRYDDTNIKIVLRELE
jgi:hypothetical protein